jgi:hypothetical protein
MVSDLRWTPLLRTKRAKLGEADASVAAIKTIHSYIPDVMEPGDLADAAAEVHIPVENERGFQRIVNTYSRRT